MSADESTTNLESSAEASDAGDQHSARCHERDSKAGVPDVVFMKRALERYGTQFLDYFGTRISIPKIDYDAWIYALRAACAGCLALYISFSLNLDGSHWA